MKTWIFVTKQECVIQPNVKLAKPAAEPVSYEGGTMNILFLLNIHSHYWGIPHERQADKRIVQTCYECSAEREVKIDLRPTLIPADPEWVRQSKAA